MNNYNGNWYYGLNPEIFIKKQQEKADLKKVGFYTGVAILLNIFGQNFLVTMLALTGLSEKYLNDGTFAAGFDIIYTVVALLVPFMLVGRKMKEHSHAERVFYLGGPYRGSMMLPAVIGGVGCCMGANIVTNYISLIFNDFGYEPSDIEFNLPDGFGGFILSLIRMAVVAGIVEELAMRGYLLGNLRFYGDKFAIIMSSVIFAVIHGNFTQIPFALLSAFGLGYFSVKTGTMWTGVIIHMLNNALSVAFYYMPDFLGENASLLLQLVMIYGLVGVGVICTVHFNNSTKDIPLYKGESVLDLKEKVKAYFSSFPMIASLLYFVYLSVSAVTEIN